MCSTRKLVLGRVDIMHNITYCTNFVQDSSCIMVMGGPHTVDTWSQTAHCNRLCLPIGAELQMFGANTG